MRTLRLGDSLTAILAVIDLHHVKRVAGYEYGFSGRREPHCAAVLPSDDRQSVRLRTPNVAKRQFGSSER